MNDEGGRPIFPKNGKGQPMLPTDGVGLPYFPNDRSGHPIFPQDAKSGEPLLPVSETGKPVFPTGVHGKPVVPLNSQGMAVFPIAADGTVIFPETPEGKPIPPVTTFGNPVVPFDSTGHPVVPYDGNGRPLIYMGGCDGTTPMTAEEYAEFVAQYSTYTYYQAFQNPYQYMEQELHKHLAQHRQTKAVRPEDIELPSFVGAPIAPSAPTNQAAFTPVPPVTQVINGADEKRKRLLSHQFKSYRKEKAEKKKAKEIGAGSPEASKSPKVPPPTAEGPVGGVRFISFAPADLIEQPNFENILKFYRQRGVQFNKPAACSLDLICKDSQSFLQDGMCLLTNSYSDVVLAALTNRQKTGANFEVFVTESQPDASGRRMHKELQDAGIRSTLVLDSAVGYLMERIDAVLVGAEGVMETGGIINKIGTLNLALCAKMMSKPVYVMAESIKFVKEYTLNQTDIPEEFKYRPSVRRGKDLSSEHPEVDYTPPSYITLLFTDLGILTPAAVGEELAKLYA